MNELTLKEAVTHFNFVDADLMYCYLIGDNANNAQWLECREPCTISGQSYEKHDLIMLDKSNGEICGYFRPVKGK